MSKNGFVNFLTIIIPIISSAYLWIFGIIYVPSISVFALAFITTGVLIGFLVSVKGVPLYNISFLKDPRLSFFVILILMVLMAGTVFFAYKTARKFTSIVYFGQANKMLARGGNEAIDRVEGKILAASKLNQNDLFFRSLSELYLYKLNSTFNQASLSEQNKADLQIFLTSAEQSARQAIEFDKTNYTNWLNLGLVYESIVPLGVEKSYENALSAYKEALALNPKSPSIHLRLARLEVAAKNLESAQSYVNNALNEKPNYIDAIIFKAQIDFSMGNKEQARQDLEMALAIDPNNQDVKSLLENLNRPLEVSPEVSPEVNE
jgi:tetratricopeptide (TPR) repeat protein